MKVALVHDMIVSRGGAERVLLYFAEAFPDAPSFVESIITTVSELHERHVAPAGKGSLS